MVLQSVKFSRKVVLWSVFLYLVLGFPISLLHESGHVYVCAASGFDYRIWLDARGGHMACFGNPGDGPAENARGGVFGLAGSAAIVAFWRFVKRHYAILAVGLAYAVDQAAKVILEGFFTKAYLSGAMDLYITALQVASWVGFMLYFARIPEKVAVSRN